MMRQDILFLVAEDPEAHGIFDRPEETQRMVYCAVKSVSSREYYEAKSNSLDPAFVFVLRDYAEYRDEKICIYGGTRYRIIRTYVTQQNGIELTVEEATVDG